MIFSNTCELMNFRMLYMYLIYFCNQAIHDNKSTRNLNNQFLFLTITLFLLSKNAKLSDNPFLSIKKKKKKLKSRLNYNFSS